VKSLLFGMAISNCHLMGTRGNCKFCCDVYLTCDFNFFDLDMYVEAVAFFGIRCSHLEAEVYVVEYVGYHSGIICEGCRAFEYPKWEQFKQTARRDRGATKLHLVHLRGQCCDCDSFVSLLTLGKSLMIFSINGSVHCSMIQ
jgi:hypothetical protein